MEKIIWGFIKFYLVYMAFGIFANIILYASADLRCFVETGDSFIRTMIAAPESISEEMAFAEVLNYLQIAFDSIPGDGYFSSVLGIAFNGNVSAEVFLAALDLIKKGEAGAVLINTLWNYEEFWREMAVATCASMVLYAVMHLRKIIAGKSISVILGFAFASVFWIFAAFTFGEAITYALEIRVSQENLNVLYIGIIIFAALFESVIHAYGGKCRVARLIIALLTKVGINLLRCIFAWYFGKLVFALFSVASLSDVTVMLSNLMGILISSAVVIVSVYLEGKLFDWAEEAVA